MKFRVSLSDIFPSLTFISGSGSFTSVTFRCQDYHICSFKNIICSSVEFSHFMGIRSQTPNCHLIRKTQLLISWLQKNLCSVIDFHLLVVII